MKRNILFCFLLLSINLFLFAQNFSLDGSYPFIVDSGLDGIEIKGNQFIYKFYYYDYLPDKAIDYSFIHIDGMPFLKFSEPFLVEVSPKYLYENEKDFKMDDKMLLLAGQRNGETFIIGTTTGFIEEYPSTEPAFIESTARGYKDASSTLVEGKTVYAIDNLCKTAAAGYGIGESFVIENSWNKYYPYLLIMNGYISYKKPYLYKQNGRIKEIKVTGLKSGNEQIVTVLDTPHPQTVDISFIKEAEDIKITIVSVYEGTKYEDTCINYLVTFQDEVIPYENSIGENEGKVTIRYVGE